VCLNEFLAHVSSERGKKINLLEREWTTIREYKENEDVTRDIF